MAPPKVPGSSDFPQGLRLCFPCLIWLMQGWAWDKSWSPSALQFVPFLELREESCWQQWLLGERDRRPQSSLLPFLNACKLLLAILTLPFHFSQFRPWLATKNPKLQDLIYLFCHFSNYSVVWIFCLDKHILFRWKDVLALYSFFFKLLENQ